ncbi:MAG: GTPase ObgE [Ignavibacteriales bacterium]|nr:MAG: GTPase ObgE [Ignavibacteriales bacterium]
MFIDYAEIEITSGDGGKGAVTFRREKYVPKGGPSGGNGGNGGSVIFETDINLSTLLDFRYKKKYSASSGAIGGSSLKDGKSGSDIIIKVPVGTIIKNSANQKILYDLDKEGMKVTAAKGGKGGRGNSNFATPTNQAPRYAEPGTPGESKKVILELKLIADVGLIGFPNAGKSTLISTISAAKPKIADYPFTTLEPNLGIVRYKDYKSFTVADIPGLIEGAHTGKGLGHKFLRHIERTRILLFLIESTSENPQQDYNVLLSELKNYNLDLVNKKRLIAFTKCDLLTESEIKKLSKKKLKNNEGEISVISSATKEGIEPLLDKLWNMLHKN